MYTISSIVLELRKCFLKVDFAFLFIGFMDETLIFPPKPMFLFTKLSQGCSGQPETAFVGSFAAS